MFIKILGTILIILLLFSDFKNIKLKINNFFKNK